MGNVNLALFFCLLAPMVLMLPIFHGSARVTLIALMIGFFMACYSAEVSGMVFSSIRTEMQPLTIIGTPIIEETLKLLPVILFAFFSKSDDRLLLEFAFSVGIGFAAMENLNFLASGVFDGTPLYAIVLRSIWGGIIHGGNTLLVGFGATFIHKKRKLFFTGTFALFSLAVIIHSVTNMIVSADQPIAFLVLMLVELTYFIALIVGIRKIVKA